MEQKFYTDDFEQLLKEKSDQFRMYPSKRVWHSIYNNFHPGRRWPSVAMSLLLIGSLSLIGYLNTSDNTLAGHFTGENGNRSSIASAEKNNLPAQKIPVVINSGSALIDPANSTPTVSKTAGAPSNYGPQTVSYFQPATEEENIESLTKKYPANIKLAGADRLGLLQAVGRYINTNQLFADIAAINKRINIRETDMGFEKPATQVEILGANKTSLGSQITKNTDISIPSSVSGDESTTKIPVVLIAAEEKPGDNNILSSSEKEKLTPEEKSWIENYALYNLPPRNKRKDRMKIEFYATPAVNYRKLSTNTKGSNTPFANSDINHSISQKPGVGLEAGIGLEYAIAKNLRLKAGAQFNYTNFNINAEQTNHPILTSILLTDTYTGYSYPASRSSSISNNYNSSAIQPVVLHNRTYQISVPIGFAYRLSGNKNVEWFAGASFQPTYVFGGKAHLISTDLKNYVYDPSSIRNWNLNLGFETYMNYKLGAYNLLVGPQVRYQVYSTYRKNIALIEKPYAIGLKLGIIKGF